MRSEFLINIGIPMHCIIKINKLIIIITLSGKHDFFKTVDTRSGSDKNIATIVTMKRNGHSNKFKLLIKYLLLFEKHILNKDIAMLKIKYLFEIILHNCLTNFLLVHKHTNIHKKIIFHK